MQEIVIGKHTLESLTTGMYSDPFVVYREYVQNAADSIDLAFASGLLRKGEERIEIFISAADQRISISDNGVGLGCKEAAPQLLNIGNSRKISANSRGFRGIGRLSGLSYCKTLIFETSACGEALGTRIMFDAQKLSAILSDPQADEMSATEVLKEIHSRETYPEKEGAHYFKVEMQGVDPSIKLTDLEETVAYLSQNLPVPYDADCFGWGREIIGRFAQNGYQLESYHIYVACHNSCKMLFKPYRDHFFIDKAKRIEDRISDIQSIKLEDADGQLMALGWLGKSSYFGSIYDRRIKGIRIRKGNILIGDNHTLNKIFGDPRFNGWCLGEIFALSPNLIPNARRDGFEKNATYFQFIEKLTHIASNATKEIRRASLQRNPDARETLDEAKKICDITSEMISKGVEPSQKGALKNKLYNAQSAVQRIIPSDECGEYDRQIAFDDLDMLMGALKGATAYKALNMISSLTVGEKKILERIFNIISEADLENPNELIGFILEHYTEKSVFHGENGLGDQLSK